MCSMVGKKFGEVLLKLSTSLRKLSGFVICNYALFRCAFFVNIFFYVVCCVFLLVLCEKGGREGGELAGKGVRLLETLFSHNFIPR